MTNVTSVNNMQITEKKKYLSSMGVFIFVAFPLLSTEKVKKVIL